MRGEGQAGVAAPAWFFYITKTVLNQYQNHPEIVELE